MKQLKAILAIAAVSVFGIGAILGLIAGERLAERGRMRDHLESVITPAERRSLQSDCARDLIALSQLVVFDEERLAQETGVAPPTDRRVLIDQLLRLHGVANGIGAVLVPADLLPPGQH